MRCKKAKKLLLSYMMGEMKRKEKIEEHLAVCSGCTHELETLRETWELLDASEEIDVPEHLTQKIEKQVADLTGIEIEKQGVWTPLRWSLAGAVTALACCILAVLLLKPSITQEADARIGDIKIGFYVAEHERAAQYVSFQAVSSRTPSLPRWVPMSREDMFYYDGSEAGDSGVFLRSQGDLKGSPGDEQAKPGITEGEIITLSQAQKLMPFSIIAPEVLGGSYKLELVVKIKGKECIQLVYSDGANTLSLFEQPVWTEDGIGRKDFQEYVLHKAREGQRDAVLGWLSRDIAFSFVGKVGFSELIQLAEEIQEKIATDRLKDFYENLYGEQK